MLFRSELSLQSLLSESCKALIASPSPMLDSEVLLAFCLDKNRAYFRAWPEKTISEAQLSQFSQLIEQRIKGVPVAYLLAEKEFWSRPFKVSPDVLIPRPETELLIEIALPLISNSAGFQLADLGTGSGAIAITLGLERPKAEIIAIDNSANALVIAKHNADHLKANNVTFLQSSWLDKIGERSFDLIVSNPPYIAVDDSHLTQGDVRFEPNTALIADKNGLSDFQLIIQQVKNSLKPAGYLLLEHGFEQHEAVQALLSANGYSHISSHTDLLGHSRVTQAQWNA